MILASNYVKNNTFLNKKMTRKNVGAQFGSATAGSAGRAEPFEFTSGDGTSIDDG